MSRITLMRNKPYQRALDLKPNNVPRLNGMAWVNGGRHEFEKSIEWANKAIAISPKDNDAYGLIGDADVEMGNYDAAYTHYQQMLDIRPDTSSYSRGAHLIWLMGDKRKAMWLMAKAIKAGGPYAENTAWCRAQLAIDADEHGGIASGGTDPTGRPEIRAAQLSTADRDGQIEGRAQGLSRRD